MAEFVRAQIFGTTFEITSRFVDWSLRVWFVLKLRQVHGLAARWNGGFWTGLVGSHLCQSCRVDCLQCLSSSAKDQLTGQAVAVKKIMKPFSTPVLSKRTYRELKLLKHLRHENVRECMVYNKAIG
jgi:p38 MAP kinase